MCPNVPFKNLKIIVIFREIFGFVSGSEFNINNRYGIVLEMFL